MNIVVQIEPPAGCAPAVEYQWDADTDILSARLAGAHRGAGPTGSVGLEGRDGSWLILDVSDGRLSGVEVAVWPDVRASHLLVPPAAVEEGTVRIPLHEAAGGETAVEVDTVLAAQSDAEERLIYFKVGATRPARTIRLGADLLLDVDRQRGIAGLWFLNVPPFPST